MDTWSKSCMLLNILVWLCLPSNASVQNGSVNGDERTINIRRRRQNGYLYEKPNVSFNLPSRQLVTTTTPSSVFNRIPAQMFYAYPVSMEINTKTTPPSGSTVTRPSHESGYNYEIQNPGVSQVSGNVGYSSSGSPTTGAADELGYNYERQDTESTQGSRKSVSSGATNIGYSSTASRTVDGFGYNYEKQDTGLSKGSSITENLRTASRTANGYNYEREDIAVSHSSSTKANVPHSSVGSINIETFGGPGYSYARQESGVSQENVNTASVADKSSESTGTLSDSGYNYEKQSIAKSEPIVKPQLSYFSSKHNPESNLITEISTNAPKYLLFESYLQPQPKHSSKIKSVGISEQTKSQNPLNSGYLTPNIDSSKVEMTGPQSGGVQKSIGIISTKTANAQRPSSGYLTSRTVTAHHYLPPANSYLPVSQVPPPASTYLPPIFN